jgi:rod shape-determining protein MreC
MVRVSYALTSAIFLIGSVAILAISLLSPLSVEGVRTSLMDMAAPVIHTVNAPLRYVSDLVRNTSGLASLQQHNADLKEENVRLKEWYLKARTLQTENTELKTLLNLKSSAVQRFATAEILADTASPFAKSIMIKAGQDDGIIKGAAVIGASGVVGRVIEAGNKTSRVLLLSDMNSRIPVIIDIDGQPLNAMLAGRNDDYPNLHHIPEGQIIKDGAHIVTSGLGGIYPRGLAVGQVRLDPNGTMHVVPYIDINELTYLQITLPEAGNAVWE